MINILNIIFIHIWVLLACWYFLREMNSIPIMSEIRVGVRCKTCLTNKKLSAKSYKDELNEKYCGECKLQNSRNKKLVIVSSLMRYKYYWDKLVEFSLTSTFDTIIIGVLLFFTTLNIILVILDVGNPSLIYNILLILSWGVYVMRARYIKNKTQSN